MTAQPKALFPEPERPRFPRHVAIPVAKLLCDALKPACWPDRLICAGSMRRRRESVKDIELVYVSKVTPAPADDFFKSARTLAVADQAIEHLLVQGTIAKRLNVNGSEMWGAKNKLAVHVASGIGADFFATTEEAFFNYLVCRTGPAELNTLIASRAQEMGWKWNPYGPGFSRPSGLGEEVVRMESERAVFEFVNLEYREPWDR